MAQRSPRNGLAHAAGGTVPGVRNPLRFSVTPLQYQQAAPVLGQHTVQVLEEVLSLDADRLRELQAAGVIDGCG